MGKTDTCPSLKNVQDWFRFNYNIVVHTKRTKIVPQEDMFQSQNTPIAIVAGALCPRPYIAGEACSSPQTTRPSCI